MPSKKLGTELLNKNITIRTDAHQFEVIKEAAWRRKSNASTMIRNILLERIKPEEVIVEQKPTA